MREAHPLQPRPLLPRRVTLPHTLWLLRRLSLLRPPEGHPLRSGGRLVLLRPLMLLLPPVTRAAATLPDLLQQKDVPHQAFSRVLAVPLVPTPLPATLPVRVKVRLHLQAASFMVTLLRWLLLSRLSVKELP